MSDVKVRGWANRTWKDRSKGCPAPTWTKSTQTWKIQNKFKASQIYLSQNSVPQSVAIRTKDFLLRCARLLRSCTRYRQSHEKQIGQLSLYPARAKGYNYKVLYDCMTHHRANVDRLRLTSVIFRNLPICIQLLLNSRSATRMQPLQTHLSKALEVFSCPYMSQQFSSRSTRAFYHVLSMENMENQNLRSFKKIKDNERQRKHHVVHLYLFRCFPIFCCAQLWNSIGFYPAWPFCWAAQFAKFHWPGPRPGDRSTAQQMCKSEPTWFYMSALPKRDWDIPLYIGTFKARPATESWYTIQTEISLQKLLLRATRQQNHLENM